MIPVSGGDIMSTFATDRTEELELRLRAIRINPDDTCIFFEWQDGGILGFKQCKYCKYSKFEHDDETGLCKFKK